MTPSTKPIAIWLFTCCAMVVLMVWIGGVTRLTDSGLSMTDWHPIHGVVPPTTDAEWAEEFANYQASPEYQQINKGMSLADFQRIFYIEYIHRMAGRATGLVFLVPFLVFFLLGQIPPGYSSRLFFIFLLGGAQGVIGWYMVKSGLVDVPAVSHYRLTLHLLTAFLLFSLLWWHALLFWHRFPARVSDFPMRWHTSLLTLLLVIQIAWGGFVAGLDAGLLYPTWPDMNGTLLPKGLWFIEPWWQNLLDNHGTVQFIHRSLAIFIAALGVFLWLRAVLNYRIQRISARVLLIGSVLLIILCAQFALGVLTLLGGVPLALASAHQLGALALLAALLAFRFYLSRPSHG